MLEERGKTRQGKNLSENPERECRHNFFFDVRLAAGEEEKGGQASRQISNTKLKSLLIVHLYPIKLVVFKQSSGIKDPGTSHLQGGLALRCFQRLSFPDIATQRCLCRDNWNTRGRSFPVLSY